MSEDLTQHLPNNDLKLILVRLDSIDTRLNSVDARLDAMNARLDSMDARLDALDTRLATLEDKVERRLLETRPIWERVLEQLKEVSVRLTGVENETKNFRRMLRSSIFDVVRVQEDFEDRLEKLEGPNAPR
jgi:chromosome segregation ATPase